MTEPRYDPTATRPVEHVVKCDWNFFQQIVDKKKPWELRYNDRDYRLGQRLYLLETVYTAAEMKAGASLRYSGREIRGTIVYTLPGPRLGIAEGWILMTVQWHFDEYNDQPETRR